MGSRSAADQVGYTFNWFYIDDEHIAYFNSGLNPVRARGTNPLFPTWSTFPWRVYDATNLTEAQTPQSAHPQAVDQPSALESSLSQAIGESPQQVYPADGVCQAGDQMCSDAIQFRAIGAIAQPLIEWINRPTFQQAVEIQGHAP